MDTYLQNRSSRHRTCTRWFTQQIQSSRIGAIWKEQHSLLQYYTEPFRDGLCTLRARKDAKAGAATRHKGGSRRKHDLLLRLVVSAEGLNVQSFTGMFAL
jgi:hypothetical protein